VRTNVLATADRIAPRSVMITSASRGEGKTTTAANLGIVIARSVRGVVLVSADLRDDRLARLFGRPAAPGLTDVLSGRVPLEKAVADTDIATLKLLPAGTRPEDPPAVLGSSAMKGLLDELTEHFEMIIVDATALLGIADALALAPMIDAVLIVVDRRRHSSARLMEARRQLFQNGSRVWGVISNRAPRRPSPAHELAFEQAIGT